LEASRGPRRAEDSPMKRILIITLLVASVICQNAVAVTGSTFSARIERDMIGVKISSTLSQNITSLFEKKINISGDSLTNLTRAFEKKIRARSPEATVRDLLAYCTFTNNTIEVAVQFNVFGVVSRRGEVVTANLTWRTLNIPDDLSVENVGYNLVGKAYFRGIIQRFENMTGARFYENRTLPATTYRAKDIAGNITMLGFKSLGAPLSKWQMTYNITKAETSYKLNLGNVVDLAVKRELNASVTEFGILMDLAGEITTSGYARLKGDLIESEVGIGTSEILILMAVAIPMLIAVTAHTIETKRLRIKTETKRK